MVENETVSPAHLRDGVPDWDAINFDVTCVRCGYNLKLLEQPRCPECGLEFEWHRVINYHHSTSGFLFEHQWRQRPVRSLLTTWRRAFLPGTFWARVSMFERVRGRPLLATIAIAVVVFLLVFHGVAWLAGKAILWVVVPGGMLSGPYFTPPGRFEEVGLLLKDIGETPFEADLKNYLWFPGGVLLSLAAALLLVMLLGETLGKCRVRRVQVLRVFAYAALPAAIVQPLIMLGVVIGMQLWSDTARLPPPVWAILLMLVAVLAAFVSAFGAYLALGFKHYLRIPRPWPVGMTAAFTGILAFAALMAATTIRR